MELWLWAKYEVENSKKFGVNKSQNVEIGL
jgi:hypothetical protein